MYKYRLFAWIQLCHSLVPFHTPWVLLPLCPLTASPHSQQVQSDLWIFDPILDAENGSESARTPCTPPGKPSTCPCWSWSLGLSSSWPAIQLFPKKMLFLCSTIPQGQLGSLENDEESYIEYQHTVLCYCHSANKKKPWWVLFVHPPWQRKWSGWWWWWRWWWPGLLKAIKAFSPFIVLNSISRSSLESPTSSSSSTHLLFFSWTYTLHMDMDVVSTVICESQWRLFFFTIINVFPNLNLTSKDWLELPMARTSPCCSFSQCKNCVEAGEYYHRHYHNIMARKT